MTSESQPPRSGPEAVDAGSREHYDDPVLYNYEYRRRRDDVAFYRQLAEELVPPPGPILDLACGSGRVTVPLARAGYQVVALDASAPMLAEARRRLSRQGRAVRERVTFVEGDMRDFDLGQRFPLVVMAFNSFEHLYTRVEVEACLARVRDHLEDGGALVFDVQNPNLRWLTRDPEKRWARTRFTHPGEKRRYLYTSNHDYDAVSQIAIIRMYYQPLDSAGDPDGEERCIVLSQRKFFPAELEALLFHNGFKVLARFGDFAGDPLHDDCDSQVVLCAPEPAPGHAPSGGAGPTAEATTAEVIAAIGLVRDDRYMYFVKGTSLWRMPYGQRDQAEAIVALDIDERDPDYVYALDANGHVVRIPRAQES